MSERFTVATWNVERVSMRSWKRLPAIQAAMSAVDADVWVLTETREGLCPADGYHALHTALAERGWTVDCWEPISADGVRMSDHPGVAVTIDHLVHVEVLGSVVQFQAALDTA